MSIDEAIMSFLSTKVNMSTFTIDGYKNDLYQFKRYLIEKRGEDKTIIVSTIKKCEIQNFLTSLIPRRKNGTGETKATTKNRKLASIRGLFQHLVDEEIILKSPAESINWSKEGNLPIMFLTKDLQEKVLWTALRNRENGLRDFMIMFIGLNVGPRLIEIHRSNVGDIDINDMVLKIKGKGNKHREVVIHEQLIPFLTRFLKHIESEERIGDKEGVPLFINEKGKYKGQRISRNSIEKMVTRVFRQCGIHEGSIHRLRHSFAVNCLEQKMNIVHIMHLLGHSNIATTIRYLRLSDEMVLRQVRENYPLAFISIDNISEYVKGRTGEKLHKSLEIVKNDSK